MNDKNRDRLKRAREHLQSRRPDEAEKLCREVVKDDKTSAEAWSLLAVTLMSQGFTLESLDAWKETLRIDDTDSISWSNYGSALFSLRRMDDAERALKKSLELDNSHCSSWYTLGNIYLESERYKLAEDAYRNALKSDSSHQMFWANLGAALSKQQNFAEALDAYKEAITLNPSYVIGWQGYALSLKKLNRFDEAATAFQEYLRLAPEHGALWNEYGLVLHELGRNEEELEAYRKATKYAPRDAWAWNNLGGTLLNRKQLAEAEAAFRKALEINPNEKSFWAGLHDVLHEMGGRVEEAQHARIKSMKITVREGDELKDMDIPEKMMENLTQSLTTMQKSLDKAYELLGQGRIDEAERMFKELISKYPPSPELQLPLADIYIARGKYVEALEIAENVIKTKPEIGLSWNIRGRALIGLGAIKKAEESMKRSIEVEPNNRWLKVLYDEWQKQRR